MPPSSRAVESIRDLNDGSRHRPPVLIRQCSRTTHAHVSRKGGGEKVEIPCYRQQKSFAVHSSRPSLAANPAMNKPASGSAHHQPKSALAKRPTRRNAERYVQSIVWVESA